MRYTDDGGESWQGAPLRYQHGLIRQIELDDAGNGYAFTLPAHELAQELELSRTASYVFLCGCKVMLSVSKSVLVHPGSFYYIKISRIRSMLLPFGTALSLDGNQNYLEVPHHELLDLEKAYTIEFWINSHTADGAAVVNKWSSEWFTSALFKKFSPLNRNFNLSK